jgi:hypothetical protein
VQRQHFPLHPTSHNDTGFVMARTGTRRPEFECYDHHLQQPQNNASTQLVKQREAVKAQLRWAALYGRDEELLNLLRIENYRLLKKIMAMSRSPG